MAHSPDRLTGLIRIVAPEAAALNLLWQLVEVVLRIQTLTVHGGLLNYDPPMRAKILVVLAFVLLTACSTSKTRLGPAPLSSLQDTDSFAVLVCTGDPYLDKIVYEHVFSTFGYDLPLKEEGPFTGVMEILCTSYAQNTMWTSTSTSSSTSGHASGWYAGRGYVTANAYSSGNYLTGEASSTMFATGGMNYSSDTQTQSTTSVGMIGWQNGNMKVVLKRANGQRLWNGDYRYKGGWEMSGWTVKTAEEAAQLMVDRLHKKFTRDYRRS